MISNYTYSVTILLTEDVEGQVILGGIVEEKKDKQNGRDRDTQGPTVRKPVQYPQFPAVHHLFSGMLGPHLPACLMGPLSVLPPKPNLSQKGGAQWASQWQFFLLLHTFGGRSGEKHAEGTGLGHTKTRLLC